MCFGAITNKPFSHTEAASNCVPFNIYNINLCTLKAVANKNKGNCLGWDVHNNKRWTNKLICWRNKTKIRRVNGMFPYLSFVGFCTYRLYSHKQNTDVSVYSVLFPPAACGSDTQALIVNLNRIWFSSSDTHTKWIVQLAGWW